MSPPNALRAYPAVLAFISYAHDDARHVDLVREFAKFLRTNGIEVRIDFIAAETPQAWDMWTLQQLRTANFVLIIASPQYKRRADGEAAPDEGRGVQWEARIIRQEIYADQDAARKKFLPVVLPGGSSDDLPLWLARPSDTHFNVTDFT